MHISIFLVILFSCVTPVTSWWALGHQLTASIGKQRLNSTAVDTMKTLLQEHENYWPDHSGPVTAATWADIIKEGQTHYLYEHLYNSWHFYDVPYPVHNNPCPVNGDKTNNVVWALHFLEENFLSTTNQSAARRGIALRLFIHFMGDVHQPLHCLERCFKVNAECGGLTQAKCKQKQQCTWDGSTCAQDCAKFNTKGKVECENVFSCMWDNTTQCISKWRGDEGGNLLPLHGKYKNLHMLWDDMGGLNSKWIQQEEESGGMKEEKKLYDYTWTTTGLKDLDEYAMSLVNSADTKPNAIPLYDCAYEKYCAESLQYAKTVYGIKPNATPSVEYLKEAQRITHDRVVAAGVRLAHCLGRALAPVANENAAWKVGGWSWALAFAVVTAAFVA